MYRTLYIDSVPSSSEVDGADRAVLKINNQLRPLLPQGLLVRSVRERLQAKHHKDQECPRRPSVLVYHLKAKYRKDQECLHSLRRLYKINVKHRQLLLNP
ncbi:MAG: hypothetical protein WCA07_12460 [Gloeobacterales cyanobacterium]